jgi:hypothetical protein
VSGKWEEGHFIDAEAQAGKYPPDSSDKSVANRRRVAFEIIDDRHLEWELGKTKSDIP